jgi:hypothetical protein
VLQKDQSRLSDTRAHGSTAPPTWLTPSPRPRRIPPLGRTNERIRGSRGAEREAGPRSRGTTCSGAHRDVDGRRAEVG